MEGENGANDGGVVCATVFGGVGDEVDDLVGVDEGEGGGGSSGVGQIDQFAIEEIFHHIGEEFELVDQVGEFGRVDLGELRFEKGEFAQNFLDNPWGDHGGAVADKFSKFGHGEEGRE